MNQEKDGRSVPNRTEITLSANVSKSQRKLKGFFKKTRLDNTLSLRNLIKYKEEAVQSKRLNKNTI